MDSALRRMMLAYYDQRASEYEDVYLLGTGSSSIPDTEVLKGEHFGAAMPAVSRTINRM